MTLLQTWLRRKLSVRTRTSTPRARLRLEALEDRCLPSTVWYANAAATGAANGASWSNAFTDLQAALGAAQSGDQVWVAQGTYKPTAGTDRTASFALKDGVAVYGAFAGTETQLSQRDLMHHTTILSGDIGALGDFTDNSFHVVTATNVGASAILDGFTITAGNADGAGPNQSQGGGLFADQASPTLSDLTFTGNLALYGGGVYNLNGAPTITNAVFTGNQVETPGPNPSAALGNDGGTPALMNVTVYANTGGGIESANGGSVTLTNSVLWGDTWTEISGGATVTYSDVQGGATGTGNLNADPLFVDAVHGNLHLQPTSPAVDAGTNTGAPATDLDGRPRPDTGPGVNTVDMGAYEYQTVAVLDVHAGYWTTNSAPVHFQVLFNVPVTDFVPADVVPYGSAGATTVQVSGSGAVYDVAVSGMTQDGEVTMRIPANVVHDAAGDGNVAWQDVSNSVIYDTTPPVTTATLAGTMGNAGWYKGPVQVTLSPTDPGTGDAVSGVTDTSYSIDGGTTQSFRSVTPFTVSGDGTHTVTFSSTDNAGNGEATKSITFKIDTTAPTTTATLAGTLGSGGWYKGPVQVTLAATDATSGVASTSYQIDGGAAQGYSAAFLVSGNGTHTITFSSTDNAGNTEATKSTTFKIDATPPITTSHLSGTLGLNDWYRSAVQMTLAATDTTSGLASTSYKIDGGAALIYSAAFTVSGDGTHTVTFFSVDLAGNTEATRTTTVKIDTTPPATTWLLYGTDGRLGRYSSDVRVVLTGTDHTSGVAATYYSVDGGTWRLYQANFMVVGLGQHHVNYYSVDKAGNVAGQQSVWFQIYALPPTLYIDPLAPANRASNLKLPLAGFATSGATVGVTITDALGHSIAASTTANAVGQWSLGAVDVHTLADGMLTIRAVAANQFGRTTQVRTTTKSNQLVLAFVQEPANSLVSHVFFAVVELRDGYGNAMNLPGQAVTMSLAPPTPTGTIAAGALHGTLTVFTVGHTATFRNLSASAAGTYRLMATDGTVTTLSGLFSIIV